jgi:hypothetical protein
MNLDTEIKTLKGETITMSFPSAEDYKNYTRMPNETVRNVLINALSNYRVSGSDKKEVFLVNISAAWVLESDGNEPSPVVKNFLLNKVLPQATSAEMEDKEGKKAVVGIYRSWVIFQIYQLFGVTE